MDVEYAEMSEQNLIELSLTLKSIIDEWPDCMTRFMVIYPERQKIRAELDRRAREAT